MRVTLEHQAICDASSSASTIGLSLLAMSVVCAVAILAACGWYLRIMDREVAERKAEREADGERLEVELAEMNLRLNLVERAAGVPQPGGR